MFVSVSFMDAVFLRDEILQTVRVEVVAEFIVEDIVFVDAKRVVFQVVGGKFVEIFILVKLKKNAVVARKIY